MKLKIKLLLVFVCVAFSLKAQYLVGGTDPANVKWKQIKTNNFRIVFSHDVEEEGRRFAAMLDKLYYKDGYSLKHVPSGKLNVLFHSKTAYSNGFVAWAPKRMEIFTTSHQSIYAQDWLEQLAIHEYRHVVQMDKLNDGFTRIFSFVLGQQAVGIAAGLYVPRWLFEGDAVLTETVLSKTGRGRLPSFEQEIRAQLAEKKRYSYEKAFFGSYKNYVPNFYHMGYLVVSGVRNKYGAGAWENAMYKAGRNSWCLPPFHSIPLNWGLKIATGKKMVPLYEEAFDDWHFRWSCMYDSLSVTPSKAITKLDPRYKNYNYPVMTEDGSVVALLTGMGEQSRLVKINRKSGEEEDLTLIQPKYGEPISYGGGKIVWSEKEVHPRWAYQDYSVIRLYDFNTGKQRRLTNQSRYFSPTISKDGKEIATIYISEQNENFIDLIDAESGALKKRIATPENQFVLTPSWNGKDIVVVVLTPQGKKLSVLEVSTGVWSDITEPYFSNISHPEVIGDYVYFSGSWTGIEDVYRTHLTQGGLEKVTNSKYGSTFVTGLSGDKTLVYSTYTADGYQLREADLDELEIKPFQTQDLPIEPFLQKLAKEEESGNLDLSNLDGKDYTVKDYSKLNLVGVHSWVPMASSDGDKTEYGAQILSQNLLSSCVFTAGYNPDSQNSEEKLFFDMQYSGWWPVLNLRLAKGDERVGTIGKDSIDAERRDLFSVDATVSLPLKFDRGIYYRTIQPYLAYSYESKSSFTFTRKKENLNFPLRYSVLGTSFSSFGYGIYAHNIKQQTQRDIAPRLGQFIDLQYKHSPFLENKPAAIFGVNSTLYFPGIGRHHAVMVRNGYQCKTRGELLEKEKFSYRYNYYTDLVTLPRGMTETIDNDELYSAKIDYKMPLFYPDLNISGFLYMKRVSMNVFADYAYSKLLWQSTFRNQWYHLNQNHYSFGAELVSEIHPLRFVFPINVGVRYAYLPNSNTHYTEGLIGAGFTTGGSKRKK